MNFKNGDNIVVHGTRYDGLIGTVLAQAATPKFYKVHVFAEDRTRVVILHTNHLYPDCSSGSVTLRECINFISKIQHFETHNLADSLNIPYP